MLVKILYIILLLFIAIGCKDGSLNKNLDTSVIDPSNNYTKEDYNNYFKNSAQNQHNQKYNEQFDYGDENPIQPFLAEPVKPLINSDKLVTLSVSEDIDVKDVLIELARLAEIDIELDPKIKSGIILKVKDKPLSEVVDRVAMLAGLRYRILDNVLRVEIDTPYLESYPVDFLNLTRTNKSTYKVNVGLQSGSASDGATTGNASTSEIVAEQAGNLWATVGQDIKQIVDADKSIFKDAGGSIASSYVSLNKEAGMINLFARDRVHKIAKTYIAKIKSNVSAQALIEAKVVEVTLRDEFQSGINWNMLERNSVGFDINFANPIGSFTTGAGEITYGVLNGLGKASYNKRFDSTTTSNLISAVKLMELFGITRTLSSPRIHAMNNQQAVLSFARNHVYFQLKIESTSQASTTTTSGATDTQVTSELKTVPIGLIINLQPSINLETNEITMNIRPTISKIVDNKKDPSIVYALASQSLEGVNTSDLSSEVPVVEIKELDSILKIKSGEVMVIGGMMEERVANTDSGVPGFKDLPLLGNLFKSSGKTKEIVQTVIFIKATIVPSSSNYNAKDKELVDKFGGSDTNQFNLRPLN
ncbi:type II secretion system protein GspD [Rickettsiales endosymbiont of Stachyamoeba lipophora]|uniref:type II secretion system protein GspD n=1 Tax=Rickettsiales endosymbiont of Stachyamoeba lipophora TaxID=2486578 RepID=UPI000F648B27|nr:hypothetical protein [Rickettsiales endosymbiont of Stachyamoeba lipophora]